HIVGLYGDYGIIPFVKVQSMLPFSWEKPTVSCRNAPDLREGLPVTQRESATSATWQLLEEGEN
ncbi:MAG: hypothetical protein AB1563_03220, partial [Bacillota bacterium]